MSTHLVAQLKALGEPNRLQIARLLSHQPATATQILAQVEMSQPSLSRHIKILREAGVISEVQQGRQHVYSLIYNALTTLVVARASVEPAPTPEMPRARALPGAENINQLAYEESPPRPDAFQEWLK